jgi:hypothetical protein
MDVLGIAYSQFTDEQREAVVTAHPRGPNFKEGIIETFADGMKHRPESTFGTVNADVLALKDATYKRVNFCNVIRESAGPADREEPGVRGEKWLDAIVDAKKMVGHGVAGS